MRIICNQIVSLANQCTGHQVVIIRISEYSTGHILIGNRNPFGQIDEKHQELDHAFLANAFVDQFLCQFINDCIGYQQSKFVGLPASDDFLCWTGGVATQEGRHNDIGVEDDAQMLSHSRGLHRWRCRGRWLPGGFPQRPVGSGQRSQSVGRLAGVAPCAWLPCVSRPRRGGHVA